MLFVENFKYIGEFIEENKNHPHYHYREITPINIFMDILFQSFIRCAFYTSSLFILGIQFTHIPRHAQITRIML